MTAQSNIRPIRPEHDYAKLLNERIRLGQLYMDTLCHGRETRPHAIMLFRRVLHLDALLTGMNSAYDRDHLEVVSVREDARYHRPGIDVPVNNAELPCGLCRRMSLGLDPDVVLLHVHGGAA